MMIRCFFFFQAEDGIRDLVRSRGLGDVYKRQVVMWVVDLKEVAQLSQVDQYRQYAGFTQPQLVVNGTIVPLKITRVYKGKITQQGSLAAAGVAEDSQSAVDG